jgi:hypothetical protein
MRLGPAPRIGGAEVKKWAHDLSPLDSGRLRQGFSTGRHGKQGKGHLYPCAAGRGRQRRPAALLTAAWPGWTMGGGQTRYRPASIVAPQVRPQGEANTDLQPL